MWESIYCLCGHFYILNSGSYHWMSAGWTGNLSTGRSAHFPQGQSSEVDDGKFMQVSDWRAVLAGKWHQQNEQVSTGKKPDHHRIWLAWKASPDGNISLTLSAITQSQRQKQQTMKNIYHLEHLHPLFFIPFIYFQLIITFNNHLKAA